MTRLRKDDLEMVMEWRMRPYITQYMNTDPLLTMDKQIRWYNKIKDSKEQIYWIIRYHSRPIGLISVFDIDRINSRCSWGYYIADKDARSLKLAMYLEWNLYDYVFDVLSLHKLCNETFAENKAVIKLHIMCGGREDGIMRQHVFKNGVYHDISVGSVIADEWFEHRKTVSYEKFEFE